ncbi:MAG: ATP-binding protein [Fibromonadales bacterium]|nr:ATP-binding protein [Fibromonadales bacterium]
MDIIRKTVVTYAQVLLVLLAFALMVVLSYWFASNVERDHLRRDAETALYYTEIIIKHDLQRLEDIKEHIINMQIAESGFGLLMNGDLEIIIHPDSTFLGKNLNDMDIGISIFADDLKHGLKISERHAMNYKNEKSVVFFRQLENGWYLGIVAPEEKYYQSTKNMAIFLTIVSIVLASILSILLIRNIRMREKAKRHLEAQNHWHESILDAIPFFVSVQDLDAKWTFINKPLETFFGKNRKELIGLHCHNWGVSICRTNDCAITCAKRGQMRTFFSQNGASYQVDVEILKDLKGKVAGYIEVIQDITKMEQMAKMEAESANRAKSAFLAKMSHEIRTPMNAIMGITEIQLQKETLEPEIKEALVMIHNSSNLLLGIINDLLDLSKIEAKKLEIVPVKYEIASLINDTVQLNIRQVESKPIEFKLSIDENIPSELFGDELRVKQILNNILSNAFKYTERGEISMSVSAEKSKGKNSEVTLVFRISDTGQGMTQEQTSKLFTSEYVRFNLEANRSVEGTGLGMNITQHLIKIMNGKIFVDSKLGKGTEFMIRLPQKTAGVNVLGKKMSENLQKFRISSSSQMKKIQIIRDPMPYGKVLAVDDVESNLYVIKHLLIPYNLSIETVMSGFEAIKKIKSGKVYDIIFMDHMMPKMDGIEAVKIIRELGYTSPIVALTANALTEQAKIFLANGFDDFVSKPIDIRQLNSVLNKLIRDKHSPEVVAKERMEKSAKAGQDASTENLTLLSLFAKDAKDALLVFESTLKNIANASDEDLHLFTIKAHTMKSAFANIGESAYSQMALVLEQAGKEQDRNAIALQTQNIIDVLQKIIAEIETETEKKPHIKKEDTAYLRKQLKIISNACADYDIEAANAAIANLRKKPWTKETEAFIEKIFEHILLSDFEEAGALANDWGV